MRNVLTPMGSAVKGGKPTVRKAQSPSGRGKDREANVPDQPKGKGKP